MFCSKILQNKINQIQKRALRILHNKPNLNLDKLGELDKSTIIHIKNIITLLTEVYKTTRGGNTIFMNKIFTPKKQYYNLRITTLLSLPKVIDSKYGTDNFFSVLPIFGVKFQTLSKMNQTQNTSKPKSRETSK